ncbi:MAG: hypothetical protein HYZ11_01190 [Candidatus Tectomicrobia bacterium]|uniref:Uncharacterized protein n=1 Tax=Tectimicrobiota bacterium TaxID=2528274 RepID=A0A932HWB6_UNCTE|nr:hypothetical protein [Candidatus Tectomicrobia bacterium]
MLGAAAAILVLLGGFWLAEALFGFRIDQADILYPFHSAARQAIGLILLGSGAAIAWIESRLHARRLHH